MRSVKFYMHNRYCCISNQYLLPQVLKILYEVLDQIVFRKLLVFFRFKHPKNTKILFFLTKMYKGDNMYTVRPKIYHLSSYEIYLLTSTISLIKIKIYYYHVQWVKKYKLNICFVKKIEKSILNVFFVIIEL